VFVSSDANPKTLLKEIGMQPYEGIDPETSVLDASKIMIST